MKKITNDQNKDAIFALIFILLISLFFVLKSKLILIPLAVTFLSLVAPSVFRPFAWFWFGLSEFLGKISSTIILTISFLFIVTPISIIRKLNGADSMKKKLWKKNGQSLFVERDHQYEKDDLSRPF